MSSTALALLVIGWLAYFFLHSLLASLTVKHWVARRWPQWMPAYRILFNLVAVAALLPLLYFTFHLGGEPVLRWRGPWRWLANVLSVAAVVGFLLSFRWYDGLEFLGLRQWLDRRREVKDQERFCISPLHRHVRHPWYLFALVLLWTRDLTPAMLVSTVMVSLYFIIGSRLEERKLKIYHGESYETYCKKVPGLMPRPWKRLTSEEASRLERMALQKHQSKA